jgi:hypothetical protein
VRFIEALQAQIALKEAQPALSGRRHPRKSPFQPLYPPQPVNPLNRSSTGHQGLPELPDGRTGPGYVLHERGYRFQQALPRRNLQKPRRPAQAAILKPRRLQHFALTAARRWLTKQTIQFI